jgi:hypothetical protein
MGAWGEKAFQNDSALDWLAELDGVSALRAVLSAIAETPEDEYIDVDDGASAVAAAEIVAAALGRGRDRVPKQVDAWIDANAGALVADDLVTARHAVERVLAPNSELRSLWDENGADTPWHADMRVLLTRLGGDPAATRPRRGPAARATLPLDQWRAALYMFLRAGGLQPDAAQMNRIQASQSEAELRTWLARALDALSVEAVLDGQERS